MYVLLIVFCCMLVSALVIFLLASRLQDKKDAEDFTDFLSNIKAAEERAHVENLLN